MTKARTSPLPVVAIVGWKKSGKTTLATALVSELTARGHQVATIKHAHHKFQIDEGHTDSARHRRAGARQVYIVSPERVAMVKELAGAREPDLWEVVAALDPCDLVIVEGYKSANVAKIEVRRLEAASRRPLAPDDPNVLAIAADHAVTGLDLPVFDLGDVANIASFIERALLADERLSGRPAGAGGDLS
ncbi:MAG: molybdopterin-guanine dinucleotide biosynthesis protein B [Hyphomicrobiaceae bacterium]